MLAELRDRINHKNVLILGLGNRARGDQGVGSALVGRLQGRVYVPLIDARDMPESYLRPIEAAHADVILVVDAAELGTRPGQIALLELDQLRSSGVSTHTANLGALFRLIPAEVRPEVLLVAIQPASDGAGPGLTSAVRQSLEGLVGLFVELFGE
jgi:hydrogenase 3 maturation protease